MDPAVTSMHQERASDPGGLVTAYKLQLSQGTGHSVKFHPWDFPDVVGGFPGAAPPHPHLHPHHLHPPPHHPHHHHRESKTDEGSKAGAGGGRRSTGAFADHDYFTKPTIDITHHDDHRTPFDHDPVVKRTEPVHEVTSAELLGYSSGPLTTTIYVPESYELPEWYVELNMSQMVVFQKILRMVDSRELSVLDREELFDLLKEVVEDVTPSKVNLAVDDLHTHAGKGRVDFDELLYSLAEMEKAPAEEGEQKKKEKEKEKETEKEEEEESDAEKKRKGERYSLATKIYYSAIASFSVLGAIQSPLELQRKHKAREDQGPHLLEHFLQSKTRKMGKSKAVLKRLMADMLHNARGQFSPYIHPLPFVRLGGPRKTPHQCPRKKLIYSEEGESGADGEHHQRSSVIASMKIQELSPVAMAAFHKMSVEAEEQKEELEEVLAEKEEIFLDDEDINYVIHVYEEHGSVAARLPDIHLAPGIRTTLARISIYDPLCSSDRKRRQTLKQLRKQLSNLEQEDPRVRLMKQQKDRIKFFMPHIRRFTVPIPKFRPTPCEQIYITPTNIANMQKRLNKQLDEYRYRLKMSHVDHAWRLMERLPLIDLPGGSRERFLQVFRAYQPLRLRDIHVISPYMPNVSANAD